MRFGNDRNQCADPGRQARPSTHSKEVSVTARGFAVTLIATVALAALIGGPLADARADHGKRSKKSFKASLSGYNEVPSVSTPAAGGFRARLDRDGQSLRYELSHRDLSPGVRFSHIHLGQSRTNGGIIVFLCQTPGFPDPTALAPTCTEGEGHLTGEISAANVIGPAGQGIAPGEFDELVSALRNGAAYVNLHTDTFPPGELRGQVR